jgi:hypothetical protein
MSAIGAVGTRITARSSTGWRSQHLTVRRAIDNDQMFAALDPNWFYSTLAQSTAAIVGLGGGFLVQRILQQRNEIALPRSDLYQNLKAAYKRVDAARADADRVAFSLASAAREGRVRKDAGFDAFRVTWAVYADSDASQKGLAEELELEWIERFDDASRAAATYRDALPASFEQYVTTLETHGDLDMSQVAWIDENPAPGSPSQSAGAFLGEMARQEHHVRLSSQEVRDAARQNAASIRAFKARLVPASLYWLLSVLMALLVVGTTIPMLYLSARSEGSRLLLLVPFAILSLAFFGFIAGELRALRASGDFSKETF